ncbi:MAG TPA: LemA family protein [Jatrophihabitans sp.]|jgi:LemA protein
MTLALVVVAVVVLVCLIGLAVSYNRFVRQRNLVAESWRQVDVELQRRHDLVPNLVETVRGYAAHEREVFETAALARADAERVRAEAQSDRQRRATAENSLTDAVATVVAVAESYPQLKADQNFLALQQELVDTEDRIAASRRFYNGNVRALNTRVEAFPSNAIAQLFGFAAADYFPLDDPAARRAPQVDLGGAPR